MMCPPESSEPPNKPESIAKPLKPEPEQGKICSEALFEAQSGLVFETNLDGRFTYVGPVAAVKLGHKHKDLIAGQNWFDLILSEERQRARDNFANYLNGHGTGFARYRVLAENGRTYQVWVCIHILYESGRPNGYKGLILDADTLDKAADECNLFAAIIEQTSEAIEVTDTNGKIIYVNPAFERLTGYRSDEVVGQNARLLSSGRHGKDFYRKMWQTLDKGHPWRGRFINRRKDGTLYEADTSITPVANSKGEFSKYVAVKRDTSNTQQLEQQLRHAQKMEAIGTLAGGIAHDFNNILSAILGYTELSLVEVRADSPLRSYLDQIRKAGDRARQLVLQILSFSQRSETQHAPLRPAVVIQDSLQLLRATLPADIEIRQKLESRRLMLADASQLQQVVMNLCTNAYHAMADHGGRLTVELVDVDLGQIQIKNFVGLLPGPYIKLTVTDTGVGMVRRVREHIFEPYFTTKGRDKGTGLGMAMVHGIVQAYQGAIKVDSEPNKGTTVELVLPAQKIEDFRAPVADTSPVGGNERILFVDDEEAITDIAQTMLQSLGYQVTSKTNSVEALQVIVEQPDAYDLVITDMTMPKMTGEQLAIELRKVRADLPIIICTGFSEKMNAAIAEDMGIDAYLRKPFNMKTLADTIRNVFDDLNV